MNDTSNTLLSATLPSNNSDAVDTSGFYKLDSSGELLYAPNFVYAPGFTLTRQDALVQTYPKDGWSWYDSLEQAHAALIA